MLRATIARTPFEDVTMLRTHTSQAIVFALLAMLMAATRLHHFAPVLDASWAVFFIGGFYLRTQWRWAFPALTVLAIAIDGYVIANSGLKFFDAYCMSAAYALLILAHAALWLGGAWLSRRDTARWPALGELAAVFLVSASVAYVISNGSFYWVADGWLTPGRERTMSGWLLNMSHWYLSYLQVAAMYVGSTAMLHVLVRAIRPSKSGSTAETIAS